MEDFVLLFRQPDTPVTPSAFYEPVTFTGPLPGAYLAALRGEQCQGGPDLGSAGPRCSSALGGA